MAIIDKKRKGETITVPEVEERDAPADLLAALEASLGDGRRRSKARSPPPRAPKAGPRPRTRLRRATEASPQQARAMLSARRG